MNRPITKLFLGFRRFREKYFADNNSPFSDGQSPKTLLIGCSDSRVDPAILTEASPGELFVVRNVANLVPPCEHGAGGFHGTSSAIEFAVRGLRVENLIVLGHRQCGGIRALLSESTEDKDSFIAQWMSIATEVKEKIRSQHADLDFDEQWRLAEMESIKISVRNVLSFPFVAEAVAAGQLNVMGIYFDLEQGELWQLSDDFVQFSKIEV